MKPLLFLLLVTVFAVPPARASHVIGLDSKTVERCSYAIDPTVALLRKLPYPALSNRWPPGVTTGIEQEVFFRFE
jgi:hypothetical protein